MVRTHWKDKPMKQAVPLDTARLTACRVLDLLEPHCERIEVAGSIRRQKQTVSDIEIVCVPKLTIQRADLWGNPIDATNLLDLACAEMRTDGILADRLDKNGRPAWGTKYKRGTFDGVALDIFSCLPPNQWGHMLMVRTGPADFSKLMMTQRYKKGVLPDDLYCKDHAIWRRASVYDNDGDAWSCDRLIPTPDERDVFEVMGLDFIAPVRRSAGVLLARVHD